MCIAGHESRYYVNPMTIKCPVTPRLMTIKNEENTTLLDNFMNNLFTIREALYYPKKRLRPAIEAYLASLLFFLEDIARDHGENHPVCRQIKRVAQDLGIPYSTLQKWGEKIRIDVQLNSAKIESEQVEHQIIIGVMAAAAAQAKIDHLALYKEVKLLRNDNNEMKGMMRVLEGMLKEALSRPQEISTSSHKKRKIIQVS